MKKIYERAKSVIKITMQDLAASLHLWRYWLLRAYITYKQNYQDSTLGLMWPVLSLSLVVLILGTVWSILLNRVDGMNYYLYLLAGFPIWQFIAASVRQGVQSATLRGRSDGLPFTIFLFERICKNSIGLLNVLPIVLLVSILAGAGEPIHWLWLLPALVSLLLWAAGISAFLSVLVALRPDIKHLVESIMRLSFLATPIVWEPSRLGVYQDYVWLNPFFAPLEFVRYGITGISDFPSIVWMAPSYSIVVFCLGVLVFARFINLLKARAAGS